ncbi:MAG: universal stress protein [Gammaproteobacteria bacterium]|nr:universal stress protein [Gammaproteobacteria bacterium]
MTNYQHILLAADFSKENSIVVNRAIEMARQNDAKLSLIHVVEYVGTLYTGEIPLPDDLDLEKQLLEQAEDKLKKLASEHQLTESKCFVELGMPKQEIIRIAKEQQVDLIIIGSHGRHGLQLLLGSTANAVLHAAMCDVLAVRVQ